MTQINRLFRLAAFALAAFLIVPAASAQEAIDDGGWGGETASDRYGSSGSQWGTSGETLDGRSADMAPTLPGAPTQVPLDGGLGLLAAAGAAYAASKLRRRKDGEGDDA